MPAVDSGVGIAVTPWTTTSTTFQTNNLSPGLYSVWVQAEHADYTKDDPETGTLVSSAATPITVAGSLAIGARAVL